MDVGIVSYGAYVPRYRIKPEEIGRIWGVDGKGMGKGLMIYQKSVPSPDEDVVTIATEAAKVSAPITGTYAKITILEGEVTADIEVADSTLTLKSGVSLDATVKSSAGAIAAEKIYLGITADDLDYNIYKVTIIGDAGVGSVSINGIILNNDGGNRFVSEDIKAGEYKVAVSAKTDYDVSEIKLVPKYRFE